MKAYHSPHCRAVISEFKPEDCEAIHYEVHFVDVLLVSGCEMCTALARIADHYSSHFDKVDSIMIHTTQSGTRKYAYDTVWLSAIAGDVTELGRAYVWQKIDSGSVGGLEK